MTYQQIKSFINTYIVQNGVNAITGAQLNTILNELADYKGFDSVVVTTLPAGSDATVTVQGMTLVLGIPKGADGRDGQNAVNPFKGWFTTSNIPTTGQEGDYCYVDDDGTTKVWRWDPNAEPPAFEETADTPDTDHTQTFASNESVNEVAIDNSHLVNPVNTADPTKPVLAKADDVMQLKKKLINLPNELVNPSLNEIDLQNEYSIPFVIGTSSPYKWWITNPGIPAYNNRKCALVMATNGSIRITANETQRTHYAFLTSMPNPTTGDEVDNFVDGTGLNFIPTNTTEEIPIPDGTSYIYIKMTEGLVDYAPSSVVLLSDKFLVEKDIVNGLDSDSEEKALSAKQGAELSKKITAISDALNPFVDFPLANELFIYWRISSSGGNIYWHHSPSYPLSCQCYLIDVKPGEKFYIEKNNATGSTTTYCQWVFLADKPNIDEITEGSTPNYANNTPNNHYINQNPTAQTSAEFEIPEGCTCLYLSKSVDSRHPTGTAPTKIQKQPLIEDVDLTRPSTTFIEKSERLRYSALGLRPINFQVDENGWELPQTLQQLNVIKKSNQLRFLQWTPKHNIPADFNSDNTLDVIQANTPFTHGIPYSSNWQDYKYVGMQVSIYTFLTAINNPYSLMYTECVGGKWPKSAWSRKWINTNATSYYGLVCCGFSAAVTSCPTVWNNGDFPKLADKGKEFVKVAPEGVFIPELVQIGDIFDSSSHSYVVYSTKRDSNGNFLMRISESTRGITGASGCQFRDINAPVAGIYTHYRYMPLCNNWKFTEEDTDFVGIEQILQNNAQVTQPSQSYNNDICTFAGDKACFSVGAINDLIVLNYNLQNVELMYDRILLYKDNEQNPVVLMLSDAEDSLTDIYDAENSYNNINQIGHAYVVSNPRSGNDSDVLDAGKYRAVLSDAYGAESEPTYFEVLENPITFIPSDSYIEVKYTNPILYCSIGIIEPNDGDPVFRGKISHPLSFEEIDSMTIKIDRHDLIDYPINSLYLRLMTVGEYGVSQVIQKLVPEGGEEEE